MGSMGGGNKVKMIKDASKDMKHYVFAKNESLLKSGRNMYSDITLHK